MVIIAVQPIIIYYNEDMNLVPKLTASNKLDAKAPLILVLAGAFPGKSTAKSSKSSPKNISRAILRQLDADSQSHLKKITAHPSFSDTANSWSFISTSQELRGQELHIVSAGTKTLDRIKLQELVKAVAAKSSKVAGTKVQVYCDQLELDNKDFSWRGKDLRDHSIEELSAAIVAARYSYSDFKDKPKTPSKLKELCFIHAAPAQISGRLKELQAIKKGVTLAKELADAPPNVCTPPYLAATGKRLAKEYKKLSCSVIGPAQMKKLKMGAYLAVTQGSSYPPQLVILNYKGGKASQAPIILVGKGMTFDTGGISIKPSPKMDEMKYDMCGAASVLGAMKAVAELKLPLNVIGMVAAAENSVDSKSYRPGDILKSMSGKTVEVLNTDAEGRLVLCDTLTYAERFKPRCVIDVATLTGACIVALGHLRSGMCANDDALAAKLEAASVKSQDLVWRLPIDKTYMLDMRSNFADIANVGTRSAGTITGGGFLAEFATAYPWAHLDVAGTAWFEGAIKGATGRPIPLLVQFLLDSATK